MIILRLFMSLVGLGTFLLGSHLTTQASIYTDPSMAGATTFTTIVGIVFMCCGAVLFFGIWRKKNVS